MQTVTVFNADNITLYDMNVYIAVDSKLLPDKISPPPNAGEPLMFLSWNAVFFDGLNTNGSITNIPMEVVAWPIQSSLSVSFFL